MLTKAQIITYPMNVQDNVIAKVKQTVWEKDEILEAEIAIVKTVNNNLLNENVSC